MRRVDGKKQAHVNPAKEAKLVLEIGPLETADKGHKAKDVEHEGDEAVMPGKGDKVGIDKDDVLEVVDE
jgi:hypothetical protein